MGQERQDEQESQDGRKEKGEGLPLTSPPGHPPASRHLLNATKNAERLFVAPFRTEFEPLKPF